MSDAIPKIKPPPPRTGSSNFAALKNVSGFRELVARVTDRAPSLPNIGVMHGRSGESYSGIWVMTA